MTMNKLVLGVTGGIGSGKTAVTDRLTSHGIDIVDADVMARVVVEPGKPALEKIHQHFGNEVLQVDGQLDRAWLRQKVFAEPEERKWLESVTHPAIRSEIEQAIESSQSPYCILVSPLLFETHQSELVDKVLVVDVPVEVQVERAAQRDSNSVEQVKRIIAAQMSREDRLSKADYVVDNTQTLEQLDSTIEKLHQTFLSLVK